jgi:hypothetical protein
VWFITFDSATKVLRFNGRAQVWRWLVFEFAYPLLAYFHLCACLAVPLISYHFFPYRCSQCVYEPTMNLVSTRAPLFRNWLPARPCSCCTLPATVTHPAFPRRGISGTSSDSWSNLSATTSGTSNTNDELPVMADVPPSRFDWRTRLRSPKQREKHSESLLRASKLWYHHQNLPKGLRRVSQPQDDVMPGEPYFEEIQAYKDRFVPLVLFHH